MELEDLLSDELLEWLGNDEPDVSNDIEPLLAAASGTYEQSQSTVSTPQPGSALPAPLP